MPYGDESRGGDTFLTTVTHSNPNESLPKAPDIPEPDDDGNYGAVYLGGNIDPTTCLLYTSPSPRDKRQSRMPSSA